LTRALPDHLQQTDQAALLELLQDKRFGKTKVRSQAHGEAGHGREPGGDIIRSVEVFEGTREYNAMVRTNKDNPWKHRVATVRLWQRLELKAGPDGKVDSQVIRKKTLLLRSYPFVKMSVIAGVAGTFG